MYGPGIVFGKVVVATPDVLICLADQCPFGKARHFVGGRVGEQVAAVQVFDKNDVGGAAHDRVQQPAGVFPALLKFDIELADFFFAPHALRGISGHGVKELAPFNQLACNLDLDGINRSVFASVVVFHNGIEAGFHRFP